MSPLQTIVDLIARLRPDRPRAWSHVAEPRQVRRRRVRRMPEVWGACLHTTGRGVVARAAERGTTPLEEALRVYDRTAGPHYVIDRDGVIYQLQADDLRGAHVGISARERHRYLSGEWIADMYDRDLVLTVDAWRARWTGQRSPQHLYPARSPNACYVGIELLPLAADDVGEDGLWFTAAQHEAAVLLLVDLARRYDWPRGWHRTPRLVGHEDLDAYERWDRGGGWDPGALRQRPRWDWERVLGFLPGSTGK